MPEIEKRWKFILRIIISILLIIYSIGFFLFLGYFLTLLIVMLMMVYIITFFIGGKELFDTLAEDMMDYLATTFQFTIISSITLAVISLILVIASIKIILLRNRKFVLFVLIANLIAHLSFTISIIYETMKFDFQFGFELNLLIILGFIALGSGIFSVKSSWNSFKSKADVVAEKEARKEKRDKYEKVKETEEFYKGSYDAYSKIFNSSDNEINHQSTDEWQR